MEKVIKQIKYESKSLFGLGIIVLLTKWEF